MEAWLARAARLHGERTALRVGGDDLTYAELFGRARAVAGALLDRGLRPGDRVALAMPSEPLVVALHGCLLIGAVAVPIDLRLREGERAVRTQGAAVILSSD